MNKKAYAPLCSGGNPKYQLTKTKGNIGKR